MAAPSAIQRALLPQLSWQVATGRSLPARSVFAQPWAPEQQRRQLSRWQARQLPAAQPQRPRAPSPPRSAHQARLTHSLFQALAYSSAPTMARCDSAATLRPPGSGQATPRGPGQRRNFSATAARLRDHHFDTLKFVQRLRDEGFSEEQAAATMRVLADVIEESIQNLTRTMVPREEAERAQYTQKVDFTKLRSELLAADGTETLVARQTHDRLANDIAKLSAKLRDEIARTQASVRLDLNLEKGRVREEANTQETKIKETESKIEQEVAGLHERIEGVKFDTLRWLLGFFTGMSALMLGAWRILM